MSTIAPASIKSDIIVLVNNIPKVPNKAVYQRIIMLSSAFNVHILAKYSVPHSLSHVAESIRICPGTTQILSTLIFPFWAVWHILMVPRIRIIYTIFSINNMILVLGFCSKALGRTWIADILDDLALALEKEQGHFLGYLLRVYQQLLLLMAKRALRYADAIVILKGLIKTLEIAEIAHKCIEVTNGVSLHTIRKFQGKKELSRVLEQKGMFRLLYVGHISRARGTDTILQACSLLLQRHCIEEFQLTLVGPVDENERSFFESFINAHNLDDVVTFTGPLPHTEVLGHIQIADVCLYPFPRSRQTEYVSPIKVFEYMAFGKVVIASDLEGIRQIIRNMDNGILVEPNNPYQLADAIERMYLDIAKRQQIAIRAVSSVHRFDWQVINEFLLEQILSVIYHKCPLESL
ncbi:glycosyltransferase [Candidatus Sumerlaeota bacterium]|nr:glycosyltransferase [Candidatus Sumerlaeota bacterium]